MPARLRSNRRLRLLIALLGPCAVLPVVVVGAGASTVERAGATPCTWGTFSSDNQPGACWRPYSASSPFNRPLPSGVPNISKSAAVGARTTRFGKGAPVFSGGVAGGSLDTGHPIYFSRSTDPAYRIHCTKSWGRCDVEGMVVRIPAAADPATGDDGHMAVIDQVNRMEYDFWQVRRKPANGGTLEVSWGGRTPIGTSNATGLGGKAVAAGYGLAAGVIRPEELAAGQINHALSMTVKCTNGRSVYPAGGGTGKVCPRAQRADAPAMGARFYLKMPVSEIDALPIAPWKKTILRAMRIYGMYVGDTGAAHHGWTIKVASGTAYTSFGQKDPWVTLGQELGLPTWDYEGRTLYSFDLRRAINWRRNLRIAQVCTARGTC
jgi:hypothetical protein